MNISSGISDQFKERIATIAAQMAQFTKKHILFCFRFFESSFEYGSGLNLVFLFVFELLPSIRLTG